jgi:RimJ/RimL family protein N-acetyltransferase
MTVKSDGEDVPVVRVRVARPRDLLSLRRWRNDPCARSSSENSSHIGLLEHSVWFWRQRADPSVVTLVLFSQEGARVGTVRFSSLPNETWLTSITIARNQRGRSYGLSSLLAGESFLRRNHATAEFQARIRCENAASLKLFDRAGYTTAGAAIDGFFMFTKREPVRVAR